MCLLILIGRRLDQRKRKDVDSVAVLKIYVKRTPEGVLFSLIGDKNHQYNTIIFYTIHRFIKWSMYTIYILLHK